MVFPTVSAAHRWKGIMIRTNFIPVIGLALAIASGVALVVLQNRATRNYHAQVTLVRAENQLNQVQGMPWQVQNPRYGSPGQIKASMNASEGSILGTLDRLQRSTSTSDVGLALAPIRDNFRSLDTIFAMGLKPGGWNDPVPTIAISQAENVSLAKAVGLLESAGKVYGQQATAADLQSTVGGLAAIVALFLAFAFYFRNSRRAARSQAHALTAKNEMNEQLSEALVALTASQEERTHLLERTVEVAEHERIRLSMDLHDGPIQKLTVLAFNLDRLARRIERDELTDAQTLMGEVRGSLSAEMEALRLLMVELRPPILDEGGLSAALSDAAAREFAGTPIESGVVCDITKHQLAPELETVIYRVTCEALANARKHSRAARVDILVERSDTETLHLVIVDDGRGFDVDAVTNRTARGERFGLLGIEERVAGLGGTCRVMSRPGFGTRVEAFLPVKTRAAEEVRDLELAIA
jgi:signal transduction histidine kinase